MDLGSTFEYKDLSVGASEFFLAYIVPSFVSVGLCGVSYNTDGKLDWATLATVSQQEFLVEFFSLVHNYSSEELKISCLNICFFPDYYVFSHKLLHRFFFISMKKIMVGHR